MSDKPPIGTLNLKKGKPTAEINLRMVDKFRQQARLQGTDKPFVFKAFGCTWSYEPATPRKASK